MLGLQHLEADHLVRSKTGLHSRSTSWCSIKTSRHMHCTWAYPHAEGIFSCRQGIPMETSLSLLYTGTAQATSHADGISHRQTAHSHGDIPMETAPCTRHSPMSHRHYPCMQHSPMSHRYPYTQTLLPVHMHCRHTRLPTHTAAITHACTQHITMRSYHTVCALYLHEYHSSLRGKYFWSVKPRAHAARILTAVDSGQECLYGDNSIR